MQGWGKLGAIAGIFAGAVGFCAEPDVMPVEVNSVGNFRVLTLTDNITHPSYLEQKPGISRWHGEAVLTDNAIGLSCPYEMDGFVEELPGSQGSEYGEAFDVYVTRTPCDPIQPRPNDGQPLMEAELEIGDNQIYNVSWDGPALVETFKDPTIYTDGFGTIYERRWKPDGTVEVTYTAYNESGAGMSESDDSETGSTVLVKGSRNYDISNRYYWQISMRQALEYGP